VKTDRVVARIHQPGGCARVGIGYGSVWIPDCSDSVIARIDPRTDRIIHTFPLASPPNDRCIAVGEGGVWIVSDPSGTLVRIDPANDRVAATVHLDPGASCADLGFGSVWVSSPNTNLVFRV